MKNFVFILFCFIYLNRTIANPDHREAVRYEIDAKRIDLNPSSQEALPRSREFIRLDSTYYAVYMLEGLYKYNRSADFYGYKLAVTPLHKALKLFHADYGNIMSNLFSNSSFYQNNVRRLNDLFEIAEALESCYNILEMPDSTMKVLDLLASYHFQKDFFNVSSERAWIIHRNRFFNQSKFSFLENSIPENERLAFFWCYTRLGEIQENKYANDFWFGPDQSLPDIMNVYHQLALLHNYNQNYDSSEYYYRAMAVEGYVSWGNYGHLREEVGDFKNAISFFDKARNNEFGLNESYYYIPSLLIFKGNQKEAIEMSLRKVAESNSAPGYGWYTIALARSYLYNGQLDSANYYLNKAEKFHELHLNTTLTGVQYRFTIDLLRLQAIKNEKQKVKFLNEGWWYSFSDLFQVFRLYVKSLILEYRLVDVVSTMEERRRLLYDLFCGESTVTFDELAYLLSDFSPNYFGEVYSNYYLNDKRDRLKPYFLYYKSLMEYAQGDYSDASATAKLALQLLVDDPTGDRSLEERLITARLLNLMQDENLVEEMVSIYPQLIPFGNQHPSINLKIQGQANDQQVVREFFQKAGLLDENTPSMHVNIDIEREEQYYLVTINSASGNGSFEFSSKFRIKDLKSAREEVILRTFGIGRSSLVES